MINELFGIDYDTYYCGGVGNVKLAFAGKKTVIFYSESEMLKILGDLKADRTVDNISVFITKVDRMEYKI